ncbi:hypothetical protein BHF71_08630 [Vulcanibacillus modesticaldus]|uniref:Cell division protein n=1 Tax=Vulcanibacillus modesticaldus TaxID=337097 RepID=A0A1D2YV14_9BACI|nr:YggT family protein [Vulcanibacillus modesticaldus]OEF99539.1 hypothetical protein BHF71_08630 [Vulcanibacillus modesticaldus]
MIYLYKLVDIVYEIYYWLTIAYILMSWAPHLRTTQIGELIGKLVEPYLRPFRQIIPPLGMIDISPIVALLALWFIKIGLQQIIVILF